MADSKQHGMPSEPREYGPWGKGNPNKATIMVVTFGGGQVPVVPDGRACGLRGRQALIKPPGRS
eukprot:435167-Pyramimonas_sp.AAC.1